MTIVVTAEPMLHEPDPDNASKLEQVVIEGNLASLTPIQRVAYYRAVCESVGLNPLTKPFEYISLNGKLTLYATRGCTDQLRSLRRIEVHKLDRERADDLAIVTAYGRDHTGRQDSAIGAVSIFNLKGEALANALMKAETKAKRRLTLSLAGLGLLDEIEAESIPGGWKEAIDPVTGELAPGEDQKDLEARLAAQAAQAEAELAATEAAIHADEQPATPSPANAEQPIPESAPSPLEQAVAEMPEKPKAPQRPEDDPDAEAVKEYQRKAAAAKAAEPGRMVQCESISPYGDGEQCRDKQGHVGRHRTGSASWE